MRTLIQGRGSRYESRPRPWWKLFSAVSVLSAIVLASPQVLGQSRDAAPPISVSTLNHVALTASYLQWSVYWYSKVFGLPIVYHQATPTSGGTYIMRIGAGPSYIALSQKVPENPARASVKIDVPARNAGGQAIYRVVEAPTLPHFGWGVKDFDADRLMRVIGRHGVLTARAEVFPWSGAAQFRFEDPDGFPLEFVPETNCGGRGYLGDKCGTNRAVKMPGDPDPIAVSTLNHVALVVPDVKRAVAWYTKATDVRVQANPDVKDMKNAILRVGAGPQHILLTEGSGTLAFRPHVGLGIEGFDANQIMKRLAEHGVKARVQMRGGTSVVLLEDPDGAEFQLQDVSYGPR